MPTRATDRRNDECRVDPELEECGCGNDCGGSYCCEVCARAAVLSPEERALLIDEVDGDQL